MERMKNFHIFDGVMPLTLMDIADEMFLVCVVLTNFHAPLCAHIACTNIFLLMHKSHVVYWVVSPPPIHTAFNIYSIVIEIVMSTVQTPILKVRKNN